MLTLLSDSDLATDESVCVCRGIELPLHDHGMEPVEFLRNMGISLTPLSEAGATGTPGVRSVGSFFDFLLSIV